MTFGTNVRASNANLKDEVTKLQATHSTVQKVILRHPILAFCDTQSDGQYATRIYESAAVVHSVPGPAPTASDIVAQPDVRDYYKDYYK